MIALPHQPRTVSQGAHGRDIQAYKNGLTHAGVRSKRETSNPTFGHKMRHELVEFQTTHKLRADGVVGPRTYEVLGHFIGDYGRHLIRTCDQNLRAQTVQERVVQNALWATQWQLEPYWIYDQLRPWPYWQEYRDVGPNHYVRTDCSGFCGMIAKWSDAPTPFPSYGFNGTGNTDTMVGELPRVDSPQPADLILYSNPGHVVICIGYPYAVSFGAEPGPIKMDSRYRPAVAFRRFV